VKDFAVRIAVFALIAAALVASRHAWLPLPATFLAVRDNVQKADCIVPLNGDMEPRFRKASELYREGYSKRIVISLLPEEESLTEEWNFRTSILAMKKVPEKEFIEAVFAHFGVPAADILVTGRDVTSTYEEAVAVKKVMEEMGLKSLIVVTNGYHMRRALMTFGLVFRGTGIKIYNFDAGGHEYDPHRWWRKEVDVKMVFQEYLSIPYNLFYHFILNRSRTSFDSY